MFHQVLLRMKEARSSFSLSGGDSNRLQPVGRNPNTNPHFPRRGRVRSPLVQLRSHFAGLYSVTHSGTNRLSERSGLACPWSNLCPRTSLLPPVCAPTTQLPGLSWATGLHSRNELSGQLSERLCSKWPSTNNDAVLNRHRRDKTCTQDLHVLLPLSHKILSGLNLYNHHMVIFHDSKYNQPYQSKSNHPICGWQEITWLLSV
jgi:hypothetical protein